MKVNYPMWKSISQNETLSHHLKLNHITKVLLNWTLHVGSVTLSQSTHQDSGSVRIVASQLCGETPYIHQKTYSRVELQKSTWPGNGTMLWNVVCEVLRIEQRLVIFVKGVVRHVLIVAEIAPSATLYACGQPQISTAKTFPRESHSASKIV